jgi:hypothetical protein
MSQLNRRNALAAVAALPALAVPAAAIAAVAPDPILAVIEAHRRAWADLGTECKNQEVLEGEISSERRCSDPYSIEPGDDPRWIALEHAMRAVHSRIGNATDAMIEIEPTTIAGAAALLSYAAEHVRVSGANWPEGYESPEPASDWVKEHGLTWNTMLHMHIAKALKGMQAVENRS